MEKNKVYELLFQRMEIIQRKLTRIYLFLFIFPLVYFLLDNSFIDGVKTPLISINQAEIILLTFPIIYTMLVLISSILSTRLSDIKNEIKNFEGENTSITKKIKDLITPVTFVTEFTDKKYTKGFFGFFSLIIIYIPLIIFTLLFPLAFFGYTIYRNLKYQGEFEQIAVWSFILGLWIFLAIIAQIYSLIKKQKEEKNITANKV